MGRVQCGDDSPLLTRLEKKFIWGVDYPFWIVYIVSVSQTRDIVHDTDGPCRISSH
jgi:hypothetical protein